MGSFWTKGNFKWPCSGDYLKLDTCWYKYATRLHLPHEVTREMRGGSLKRDHRLQFYEAMDGKFPELLDWITDEGEAAPPSLIDCELRYLRTFNIAVFAAFF